MQWVQQPSNVDNLNNVRREASRYFRNKMKKYLKAKIDDRDTNSKTKNIRDLYRSINDFHESKFYSGRNKSGLKSRNAGLHSMQNLLSSSLLFKNLKIKIYRTSILPVVLYGCEIWLPTPREQRRLRVFENRVLTRIFGPERDEVTGK